VGFIKENNMSKVSVIVPVYNVEVYLDTCMQSLLNQTLKDIEIILVDDESPDNCPQICDGYAINDSRVKVIHKKNGGLGFARNSGLEIACGEYVAFVDSDDYLELNTFETLYEISKKHELDALSYIYNRFSEPGCFDLVSNDNTLIIKEGEEELRKVALSSISVVPTINNEYKIFGSSCTVLYRKSVIDSNKLQFFSERDLISEDFVFNYQFALKSHKVGKMRTSFYHYRITDGSLTHKIRLDRVSKTEEYCDFLKKLFVEDGFDSKSFIFPMGYFVNSLRANVKNILLSSLSMNEKRRWFCDNMCNKYIDEAYRDYPWKIMPLKHKILFLLAKYKAFYLMYFVVKINNIDLWKRN
jgi:glycosyltransferase involved in cell wall biosynthesis